MGESVYDGVFAMRYAKGSGADRGNDALKHMNHASTAKYGGLVPVIFKSDYTVSFNLQRLAGT